MMVDLTSEEYDNVFANMDQLVDLSTQFVEDLHACQVGVGWRSNVEGGEGWTMSHTRLWCCDGS